VKPTKSSLKKTFMYKTKLNSPALKTPLKITESFASVRSSFSQSNKIKASLCESA
jgi:hypothetical protein